MEGPKVKVNLVHMVRTYLLKRQRLGKAFGLWRESTGEKGLQSYSIFCEAPQSNSEYDPPQQCEAAWTPEVPKAFLSMLIPVNLHSLFLYQQADEPIADQILKKKIYMTPMKT